MASPTSPRKRTSAAKTAAKEPAKAKSSTSSRGGRAAKTSEKTSKGTKAATAAKSRQERTITLHVPDVHMPSVHMPNVHMPHVPRPKVPNAPQVGRVANNVANAALMPVAVARQVLPAKGGLPLYAGLGVLGAAEVLDWPVAIGIGIGYAVLRQNGPLTPASTETKSNA